MDEKSIYILELLMDYQYLSAPKIKLELEHNYNIQINVKTIRAMIERINLFYQWLGCTESFITNHHKKGYTISNPLFSDAQLRFLFDSLQTSSIISSNQRMEMINKILKLSTKHQSATIRLNNNSNDNSKQDNEDLFTKLNLLIKAIKDRKSIIFKYVDYQVNESFGKYEIIEQYSKRGNYLKDEHNETYLISPYELLMAGGMYYLFSYSSKHKDTLTIYRVDRMRFLRTSKDKYIDILDMYDLEIMKDQLVNMYIGKELATIKLKFKKEIFRSIVDQFGINNKIEKDIDDNPVITIKDFSISDGLIGWLLMMGNKIEVLAPNSLRIKMIEKLKETLEIYQNIL